MDSFAEMERKLKHLESNIIGVYLKMDFTDDPILRAGLGNELEALRRQKYLLESMIKVKKTPDSI